MARKKLLFCWIILAVTESFCQTPGNVNNNLTLWLKANLGVTGTIPITAWTDQSGATSNPVINGDPSIQTANFNYNPTVNLDGNGDFFSWTGLATSYTEGEIFCVYNIPSSTAIGTAREIWNFDDNIQFGSSTPFTDGNFYDDFGVGTTITNIGNAFLSYVDVTKQYIHNTSTDPTSSENYMQGALTVVGAPFDGFGTNQTIGTGDLSGTLPLISDMGEIILFSRKLSSLERLRIWSYLSVKYGITLDNAGGGINGDYQASDSTVIWDASLNSAYHNNIIGIGRDDNQALLQKQSHSLDDTTRIYIDTIQTENQLNSGIISSDTSYVLIGDNQGKMCSSVASNTEIPTGCTISTRLEREWKVTKTNLTENYSHDFTLNPCAVNTMVNINHLRFLVDDDGDFSNGGTQCYFNGDGTGITITYNNPEITVSNISSAHIPNNSTNFVTIASIDLFTPLGLLLDIDNPLPQNACDSFVLPPITGYALVNPQYYSDTSGTGVVIPVGTAITSDTVIYLYDQNGGNPNQFDEDTLNITINMTQTSTDIQTACGIYTWIDGNTYTASNNVATQTLIAANGCDSIITLNLTINNSNGSIDTQIVCNTYTWIDGNTYVASNNTATQTFTNSTGCDSVVTLNLTINNSTGGTDTQTACGAFTWIDGNIYTSSNSSASYTITGGSVNGCDSIVTLNLTFFPLLTIDLGEDQFICDESILLSAGANFSSYLWSDNSNESTFLATIPGVYSVTVTDNNNCSVSDDITLIEDCPSNLWVPNVFSPNGDNQNDIFNAVFENLESFSMKIFNRWGALIFETNSFDLGWDGEKNGKKVSEGTYFYIIEYSFYKQGVLTTEVVKGSVSLLK